VNLGRQLALTVGLAVLAACGETIDLRDTAPTTVASSSTSIPLASLAPGDADANDLLPELVTVWAGLDQKVVDNSGQRETLATIEGLWRLAEPQVRVERPELLFGFEQAVALARTSVERRRPADASKGYKLAVDLTNDYLSS
jgi:hypothetical protein